MKFDGALRRCPGAIQLALIAAAAYFQASGISQLVAAAFAPAALPADDVTPRSATPATLPSPDRHATSARAILENNPFDSVTPRPLGASCDAVPGALVDLDHAERAPLCDELRAVVVVASPDPSWSMAGITVAGEARTKVVRVGDDVGQRIVRVIEWNRIVLASGSSLCQVLMFRASKVASAADAGTREPPPTSARGAVPPAIASKIRRVGASEFELDRQTVADILENQMELLRAVRIVPEQLNGKVVGIRLYGVRPDTLLGLLGLETGDRLDSINGLEMTSPETGMQALANLRTADHLSVRVNRRGRDTTLDYDVR
jgi:general secretion pathway protein C